MYECNGNAVMKKNRELLKSRTMHIISGVFFSVIFMLFAYTHLVFFIKTQEFALLAFCMSETLIVGFYIMRSKPITISAEFYDWLIAIVGTFLPLLFRPTDTGIVPMAKHVIMAGSFFQILGVISLNRSFALVAANRTIKTQWMYGVVRHPIYASYCITLLGYVLTYTSIENALIYVLSMAFLFLRILSEEKHLNVDDCYKNYTQKVRYKLIPFIF
jgi:protein-S-isoprenylcysteine O-methyltransferase Ste14